MKYTAKIRLPKCWKHLVEVVFPQDLKGILSEKTDHTGVADPKPHYDDARMVSGPFPNGAIFNLSLCSGQGNYFGNLFIFETRFGERREICDDVLENFNALTVEDGDNTYEIKIKWVEDETWTFATLMDTKSCKNGECLCVVKGKRAVCRICGAVYHKVN